MRYINPGALTIEQAKVVALKVLRDTIEASVEGIGGRVQLATVEKTGLEVIDDTDMRVLHDTVDLWEAQCAELLLGSPEPPSASDTQDRGDLPLFLRSRGFGVRRWRWLFGSGSRIRLV
jgi:hypothetical protein